uniref:Uncharacterized protein n=1 Tax=Trichobilharzia regenti TaxID=157069 RepID=A0AA85K1K4_TRIRE|nr:unnamed protein product [Trichobilharzia regenti]
MVNKYIRNNSVKRLTVMIKERPCIFKHIYQIYDCPAEILSDPSDSKYVFSSTAILYFRPLCLAIYMRCKSAVEMLLSSGLCNPCEYSYASEVYVQTQGNNAGDLLEVLPSCVAIRRQYLDILPILFKPTPDLNFPVFTPRTSFTIRYISKRVHKSITYDDIFHYCIELAQVDRFINVARTLYTLIYKCSGFYKPGYLDEHKKLQNYSLFRRLIYTALYIDSDNRISYPLIQCMELLVKASHFQISTNHKLPITKAANYTTNNNTAANVSNIDIVDQIPTKLNFSSILTKWSGFSEKMRDRYISIALLFSFYAYLLLRGKVNLVNYVINLLFHVLYDTQSLNSLLSLTPDDLAQCLDFILSQDVLGNELCGEKKIFIIPALSAVTTIGMVKSVATSSKFSSLFAEMHGRVDYGDCDNDQERRQYHRQYYCYQYQQQQQQQKPGHQTSRQIADERRIYLPIKFSESPHLLTYIIDKLQTCIRLEQIRYIHLLCLRKVTSHYVMNDNDMHCILNEGDEDRNTYDEEFPVKRHLILSRLQNISTHKTGSSHLENVTCGVQRSLCQRLCHPVCVNVCKHSMPGDVLRLNPDPVNTARTTTNVSYRSTNGDHQHHQQLYSQTQRLKMSKIQPVDSNEAEKRDGTTFTNVPYSGDDAIDDDDDDSNDEVTNAEYSMENKSIQIRSSTLLTGLTTSGDPEMSNTHNALESMASNLNYKVYDDSNDNKINDDSDDNNRAGRITPTINYQAITNNGDALEAEDISERNLAITSILTTSTTETSYSRVNRIITNCDKIYNERNNRRKDEITADEQNLLKDIGDLNFELPTKQNLSLKDVDRLIECIATTVLANEPDVKNGIIEDIFFEYLEEEMNRSESLSKGNAYEPRHKDDRWTKCASLLETRMKHSSEDPKIADKAARATAEEEEEDDGNPSVKYTDTETMDTITNTTHTIFNADDMNFSNELNPKQSVINNIGDKSIQQVYLDSTDITHTESHQSIRSNDERNVYHQSVTANCRRILLSCTKPVEQITNIFRHMSISKRG